MFVRRTATPRQRTGTSMPATQRVNRLLAGLPARERARFLADCTAVELVFGDVLYEQGDRVRNVYFPIDGLVSMLIVIDEHSSLEVGMIGSEGMCGYASILGGSVAPLRAQVQGAGAAWCMKGAVFRRHLQTLSALRPLLDRYLYVLFAQLAQSAACMRFHVVEERLARWLLMTQDRAQASSFDATQESLAFMLGVRRVGVTTAAGVLQSRQLIRYKRGHVTILDRGRLEAAACSCYRSDLTAYRRGLTA
jgi:CRP-like cAMP-binding protein